MCALGRDQWHTGSVNGHGLQFSDFDINIQTRHMPTPRCADHASQTGRLPDARDLDMNFDTISPWYRRASDVGVFDNVSITLKESSSYATCVT